MVGSDQETAAPLITQLMASGDNPILKTFEGLNEIPAGSFEGDPTTSLEGILYLLGPLSWAFGDVLVPDVGDPSVNGVTFDESFGGAVQDIYDGSRKVTEEEFAKLLEEQGSTALNFEDREKWLQDNGYEVTRANMINASLSTVQKAKS